MRTLTATNTIMMVSANRESVPSYRASPGFIIWSVFSAMRIYVICDRKKWVFIGMFMLSLVTPAITAVSNPYHAPLQG